MSHPVKSAASSAPIAWTPLLFIASYHLALFIALPLYLMWQTPGASLLVGALVLMAGSLLSITAGYHRLYAHRTYRVRKPVEAVLLFFGTLAVQGSVLRWAHDHRLHHRYLDSEKDPYDTPQGFWHSHILWIFKDRGDIDERYLKDLMANRWLVFQHRYYGLLMALANIVAVAVLAWITGDVLGAVVIGFLFRLFMVHHSTWFINSLAHMWGSKPYSTEHSAVNNFILALLTYGEGYHNFHHTFAGDYRNGVRWYQFDPPKYLIWLMSKLGLAWDLKRTDPLMIEKRLVQADRKFLMEHLNRLRDIDASAFAAAVEAMAEKLSAKIVAAKAEMDRYRSLDRRSHREEIRLLRSRLRAIKQEITHDLRTWRKLYYLILELEPAY